MERSEFLAKLSISLAAVCAGCSMVGCGSKSGDPTPNDNGGNNNGGGNNQSGPLFSINLSNDLTAVGQSTTSKGVILVRIGTGNTVNAFTAVQLACTHEGTSINYSAAQNRFVCPNHGSQFNTSGAVLNGPASASLKKYTIEITGTTLTVIA